MFGHDLTYGPYSRTREKSNHQERCPYLLRREMWSSRGPKKAILQAPGSNQCLRYAGIEDSYHGRSIDDQALYRHPRLS